MKNKIFYLIFSLIFFAFIYSCNKEFNETKDPNSPNTEKVTGERIMNISYDIYTVRDYETDFSKLSDLELSSVNPSEEKQHVEMTLLESGQMNIVISNVDFKKHINIPHKTLPDDSPKIVKTEIIGNIVKFYDINGKVLGTENIPIPNHSETVKKIKEIGAKFSAEDINNTIATMQGQQFIENLEEYIANAAQNGVEVIEQGKNHVTLRSNFSNIDPSMQGASVLLIDKSINKLVGTRIYDENDKLVQTVFYGYNRGEVQSMNAIKVEQMEQLPTGKEVKMISLSKIENLKFNLNNK